MIPERILRRVEVTDDCWLWTGALQKNGYGYTNWWIDGRWKHARVHRLFYEAYKGPIPSGLEIGHLCDVRNCVNPDHLSAMTHAENLLTRNHQGPARKTECIRGHVFTEESTYINPRGGVRNCRICRTEAVRRWREKG